MSKVENVQIHFGEKINMDKPLSQNTNSVAAYLKMSDARAAARRAIGALYIELPETIADDVREKVEAAFAACAEYAEARRKEA